MNITNELETFLISNDMNNKNGIIFIYTLLHSFIIFIYTIILSLSCFLEKRKIKKE